MSNQYMYSNYQPSSSSTSSQQYSPPISNGILMDNNTSPNLNYDSLGSSISSISSSYSFHNPRLRYYLSKSFDVEDDMEFCPEINADSFNVGGHSPGIKKFNPYTASVFSPTTGVASSNGDQMSPVSNQPQSPRVSTPRIRKPLEIVNPSTKMRVSSPAVSK